MKITKEMADLIFEIEYLVGKECYNPNSYDGYTGSEGCSFRYPVYVYPNKDAETPEKYRGRINESTWMPHVEPDMVRSMRYKFGSNNLYIGEGIINILEYLEQRYNINFNDLEKKVKK